MKRLLLSLSMALVLAIPSLTAQDVEAVYIHTWHSGSEVGQPFDPDPSVDQALTFNASTQNWEGEIIQWPKMTIGDYNAKIFYSVKDGKITYYGVSGAVTQINFGNNDTSSYTLTAGEDPTFSKGFVIAMAGSVNVADVKVSLNLSSKKVTFTKFESGSGIVIPELVSVMPENGSQLVPKADGSVDIILTFSGEVTSMEVICEGSGVRPVSSDGGKVWTLPISAATIEEATSEAQGVLFIKLQNVYAGNIPVTFNGNQLFFNLNYTVQGVTKTTNFNFKGNAEGVASVAVYKSPFYTVGDELTVLDNSIAISYYGEVTCLFTVAPEYKINIDTAVSESNYTTGTAWSIKMEIDPDNETSVEENYREGTTITLYDGAAGGIFDIYITPKEDAGVDTIGADYNGEEIIYNLQGVRVDKNKLTPGIFIINGKKVLVR